MNFPKVAKDRHNVYVVQLDHQVLKRKKVLDANPNRDPNKEVLYVGSTGHTPEERFQKHKMGVKGNTFVKKHGLKLRSDLFEGMNPMSFPKAEEKEKELAAKLKALGYTVIGGN